MNENGKNPQKCACVSHIYSGCNAYLLGYFLFCGNCRTQGPSVVASAGWWLSHHYNLTNILVFWVSLRASSREWIVNMLGNLIWCPNLASWLASLLGFQSCVCIYTAPFLLSLPPQD
jgi:hypothetical protein